MRRSFLFFAQLLFGFYLAVLLVSSCEKTPTAEGQANNTPEPDSSFVNYNQGKFFPNIEFEVFGVEDGLSSASITCLLQDQLGFLWIGTDNGLNRYDGREFRAWQNDLSDSTSFPGGVIVDLAEDSRQNIWMLIISKGICCFDPEAETFQLYGDTTYGLNQVSHISRFLLDKKDRIWFNKGYFDTKTRRYRPIELCETLLCQNNFVESADGKIFAIDDIKRQLLQFDENSDDGKFKIVADSLPAFEKDAFRRVRIDKHYNFLVGLQAGVFYRFNPFSKSPSERYTAVKTAPIDSQQYHFGGTVTDIFWSENTGIAWVAQWGGLVRLDTRSGANPKIFRYLKDENNPLSLPDGVANCVLEDRSGALWVGTYSGGLAKFAPAKQRFTVFRKVPGNSSSLSNSIVTAVFQDRKQRLWVGTKKFLNQVDVRSGLAKNYPIRRDTDAYGCNAFWITSISEDTSTGKLLITYWGAGFNWFDPETGKFSKPKLENPPAGPCWMFLQKAHFLSPDSILLFEWWDKMHLYLKKKGKIETASQFFEKGKPLEFGLTSTALVDKSGTIWLGRDQEKGLLRTRFSGSDTTVWVDNIWTKTPQINSRRPAENRLFMPNELDETQLTSGTITVLFEDSKGKIWVGTTNGLHLMLDREKGIFKRFGKSSGFPDASIAAILEDANGKLWVSTNAGISLFDPEGGIVERNFNYTDGLPGNQFNAGVAFKNKRGEMFFGSTKGLCAFHPDSLGKNTFQPRAVITHVFADGKPIKITPKTTKLHLPRGTQTIRFEVAVLDFTFPRHNKFQYHLRGFGKNVFSKPSSEPIIIFTNLQPDKKYELVVKAGNNDGYGFLQETRLEFCIEPYFWQTRLAHCIALILLLVGLYKFIKYREKQLHAERERDLQLKSLQVQTHQAQMNPHFIFNVLTAIKNLIVNRRPEEAGEYLDKFAVLIRRYLDANVKSGIPKQLSVVQNEISLAQEIELIDMYVEFEQLKYEGKFTYERPQPDFVVANVSIPPMLIQPYVENAIKHGILNLLSGKTGHLKVSFTLDSDDVLICTVEDNGVGVAEAKRLQESSLKYFQSLGTSLTEERCKILNQLGYNIEVTTRDREGGGTVVVIRIS